MAPFEKQTIERKIEKIYQDLTDLELYKNLSLENYIEDRRRKKEIERTIELILGRVIDINYHILTTVFNVVPKDIYESFVEIGKKLEFDTSVLSDLPDASGTRNALAHEYDKIDDSLIYQALQKTFIQIPVYLNYIGEFLEKED